MTAHIRIEEEDGVLWLTINRPEKKNALTQDMYAALAGALRRATRDPSIACVVLSGAGDVFTAGNDLKDFIAAGPAAGAGGALQLLHALADLGAPLICAVGGAAVGIGVTLLLHADMVIASPEASFRTPFVDLGVCVEGGASLLAPQKLSRKSVAQLFYFGETLSAEAAVEAGLVDLLADEPAAEAAAHAARLAEKPRGALRATKQLMREAQSGLKDTIDREGAAFLERLQAPETQAAVMAFLSKR